MRMAALMCCASSRLELGVMCMAAVQLMDLSPARGVSEVICMSQGVAWAAWCFWAALVTAGVLWRGPRRRWSCSAVQGLIELLLWPPWLSECHLARAAALRCPPSTPDASLYPASSLSRLVDALLSPPSAHAVRFFLHQVISGAVYSWCASELSYA